MSDYDDASPQIVAFTLGGMAFEYDEEKNQKNLPEWLRILKGAVLW